MRKTTIDWAPIIPNSWETVRLKDIARLQSGNSITNRLFVCFNRARKCNHYHSHPRTQPAECARQEIRVGMCILM